jgi:hypothetical protein
MNDIFDEKMQSIIEVVILGYIPTIFLFYQSYRINKRRQITLSAPSESRFTWMKPETFVGNDVKFFANIYKGLAIVLLFISTMILLSIVIS